MNPEERLWLAIDGGGTCCRLRLYDHQGQVIGESQSGSANVQLGIEVTFAAIEDALHPLLDQAGLELHCRARICVGMGLAGVVTAEEREQVERFPHAFHSLVVESDAYTACLGAHNGEDGAILILGTGSCGFIRSAGKVASLGGWGFPISDHGSGAVLGLRLLEQALLAHEGFMAKTPLLEKTMAQFNNQPGRVVKWNKQARPADYAALAPSVFDAGEKGDAAATALLQHQAEDIERFIARIVVAGGERLALLGGLSGSMMPWLSQSTRALITEPSGDALYGAYLLARSSGLEA